MIKTSALFVTVASLAAAADLYVGGTGGYHTYRIPALLVTGKNTVLAFAEARKNSPSDHGDIDLVVRRGVKGGKTWSPMAVVYEEGGTEPITIGNPAPVLDRKTGTIHLLFTRNNQRIFATRSTDDGRTWAAPAEITQVMRGAPMPWTRVGTGPGHGIQLRNGRLLVPLWLNEKIHVNYRAAAIYSDDGGRSWQAGGLVPSTVQDGNECMIFERSDGAVVVNIRSRTHRRHVAVSRDGGRTWADPVPVEALPDPVCQGSVFSLPARRLALFANAADEKRRVNLTVRLSPDDGATWPWSRQLWAGPSGYSDLAILKDNTVLCLFECGGKAYHEKLRLERFPLASLRGGK